jgi:tetratricopeptide (TPR) repeat protein
MNIILWLAIPLVCFSDAEAPALPEELAPLPALVGEEARLVDWAREFDRQQTALGEADLKEAQRLGKVRDTEQANAKQRDAKHRFELIRIAYEFVLKHYPNNARALTYYGEVLYDRFGELDGAVRAWHLAVSLDPKLSVPLNDLGIHCCHAGEYAMGLSYYDKALKLEPNNPDYLFNLAQTYLVNFPQVEKIRKWKKEKVYREAMKLSKKAATLDPKDFELVQDYAFNFFVAENFGVKADWKDAARAWQQAREVARTEDERFNAWLNEGRVWIRAKNKTQARTCLEAALKIHTNNEVVKQLLGDLDKENPVPEKPGGKKPK